MNVLVKTLNIHLLIYVLMFLFSISAITLCILPKGPIFLFLIKSTRRETYSGTVKC